MLLLSQFASHRQTGNSHQKDLLIRGSELLNTVLDHWSSAEGDFLRTLAFDCGHGYTPAEENAMEREETFNFQTVHKDDLRPMPLLALG